MLLIAVDNPKVRHNRFYKPAFNGIQPFLLRDLVQFFLEAGDLGRQGLCLFTEISGETQTLYLRLFIRDRVLYLGPFTVDVFPRLLYW